VTGITLGADLFITFGIERCVAHMVVIY
jgi:hypothetical protein